MLGELALKKQVFGAMKQDSLGDGVYRVRPVESPPHCIDGRRGGRSAEQDSAHADDEPPERLPPLFDWP